jgi:hypothetical protein
MTLSEKQIIFAANAGRLFAYAAAQGIPGKVGTWYRSTSEQLALFARGASQKKTGMHQLGLAVDYLIIRNGKLPKDDPAYDELGVYWEILGGTWGGRWKSLHDRNHFEFKEGMKC